MAKSCKRGRVLDKFHSKLRHYELVDFKQHPQLLHDLYDQYHQAIRVLQKQKADEDTALTEMYEHANKHPAYSVCTGCGKIVGHNAPCDCFIPSHQPDYAGVQTLPDVVRPAPAPSSQRLDHVGDVNDMISDRTRRKCEMRQIELKRAQKSDYEQTDEQGRPLTYWGGLSSKTPKT